MAMKREALFTICFYPLLVSLIPARSFAYPLICTLVELELELEELRVNGRQAGERKRERKRETTTPSPALHPLP